MTDTRLSPAYRGLSLVEFVIGAAIVIGHNIFHVVPNEVPILVILGIVSIRLREGSWAAIGLGRPKSWWKTVAIGFATAAIVIAMGQFVTEPLAAWLGLHHDKSAAASIGLNKNEVLSLAKAFALTWTFAAFGEEIAYRRYLLGRAADTGNRTTLAHWLGLVAVSVLFGIGHYYQGPAGMFETGCDGFMIGAAYLLSRRNLWVAVFAHGFIDTIAFAALFLGLAD